jgi:hypothetical protein
VISAIRYADMIEFPSYLLIKLRLMD